MRDFKHILIFYIFLQATPFHDGLQASYNPRFIQKLWNILNLEVKPFLKNIFPHPQSYECTK